MTSETEEGKDKYGTAAKFVERKQTTCKTKIKIHRQIRRGDRHDNGRMADGTAMRNTKNNLQPPRKRKIIGYIH